MAFDSQVSLLQLLYKKSKSGNSTGYQESRPLLRVLAIKNSPAPETISKSKGYFGIVPFYFGGVCEVAELQVCGHTTMRGGTTRVLWQGVNRLPDVLIIAASINVGMVLI